LRHRPADELHNWLAELQAGDARRVPRRHVPHLASTRDEPGCVFFEYHRHKDDEDVVVLIECFREAEAHEFHRRTPHMIAMQADVRRLQAKLSVIETVSDEVIRYDLDFIANPPSPYRP
jgi:quinol monooxygenase YgiN